MKLVFLLTGIALTFSLNCSNVIVEESPPISTSSKEKVAEIFPKILFSRKRPGDSGWSIYMVDQDGGNEEILIPFESGMGEYNPDISPDGQSILFNTYRYGGWKLALFDIPNKTTQRISMSSHYYTNGVFSPDGKQVAYERNVQRNTHIFIADKDGKNEKMLSTNMGSENRIPVWTPDGKSILFYSEKGKLNDIYQVDIGTGEIKNLSNNKTGNDFAPSVSPDGNQVAFFSDRNGYLDLYLMDISGIDQINLTSSLQNKNNEYHYYKDQNLYWIFKVSWSPDNQFLVFSNSRGDNVDLFSIRKDGTDLKQISNSTLSEYTPTWGLVKK